MIFDSEYRRQAMDKWESERVELKTELKNEWKERFSNKRNHTKNPLVYAFAAVMAWFTQH